MTKKKQVLCGLRSIFSLFNCQTPEIGKGDYPPERVLEVLEKRDRSLAGATARACGLTLLEIRYPQWENPQIELDTGKSV